MRLVPRALIISILQPFAVSLFAAPEATASPTVKTYGDATLNIGLGLFGIVVSVVFFVIGYRQTVGARKERISACNSDVLKILMRRIVLEEYTPTRLDVARILDGKARDFRVKSDDLLSEAQVLNGLYTMVVESDLIPAEQRQAALHRIVPALVETENKPIDDVESLVPERERWFSKPAAILGTIALLASVSGAIISALPTLVNLDTTVPDWFKTVLYTAAASLAIIIFSAVVIRLRTSQEELPTRATQFDEYVRFETNVAETLKKLGMKVRSAPSNVAADFIAEKDGQKFVIEVKSWARPLPKALIAHVINRTRQAAEQLGDAKAVVVTRSLVPGTAELVQDSGVELLTLSELRRFFGGRPKA